MGRLARIPMVDFRVQGNNLLILIQKCPQQTMNFRENLLRVRICSIDATGRIHWTDVTTNASRQGIRGLMVGLL